MEGAERREDDDPTLPHPPPADRRTFNQRARDEITEQEARFARERARERRTHDAGEKIPHVTADDVEEMIAAALKADRERVLPTLAAIVNEALEEARERNVNALKHHEAEMVLSIKRLETAVFALEQALIIERNRILDPGEMKSVN
jgi:hypothetical protein